MSKFLKIVNEARQNSTYNNLCLAVSAAAALVAADPKAGVSDGGVFSPKDNISRLREKLAGEVNRVAAVEILTILDGLCRRYYGTIGDYWVQVVPGVFDYGDQPDRLRLVQGTLYRRKGAGKRGKGVRWELEES